MDLNSGDKSVLQYDDEHMMDTGKRNHDGKVFAASQFYLALWWWCFFCSYQEPHLIHKFDEYFYDEELQLVIVGYIRPEVHSFLEIKFHILYIY